MIPILIIMISYFQLYKVIKVFFKFYNLSWDPLFVVLDVLLPLRDTVLKIMKMKILSDRQKMWMQLVVQKVTTDDHEPFSCLYFFQYQFAFHGFQRSLELSSLKFLVWKYSWKIARI